MSLDLIAITEPVSKRFQPVPSMPEQPQPAPAPRAPNNMKVQEGQVEAQRQAMIQSPKYNARKRKATGALALARDVEELSLTSEQ